MARRETTDEFFSFFFFNKGLISSAHIDNCHICMVNMFFFFISLRQHLTSFLKATLKLPRNDHPIQWA